MTNEGLQPLTTTKLGGPAATAALHATHQDRNLKSSNASGQKVLDNNHRMSSAGAAASLKYADPRNLPSYPSTGLRKDGSAAGAAASLGWAKQKTFKHWKPDPSASASAAAALAQDYKMAAMGHPEHSANGARAAVLARKDGGNVETWRQEATAWGNSAASQAFKKDRAGGISTQLDYGRIALDRQGSLLAATGAMASSRKRSKSTPIMVEKSRSYPDEANAAANALSAATSAAGPLRKRNEMHLEGGSVPFTTIPGEMYTSHPPLAPGVEEQNRADVLRASAVAMAKSMYSIQQKQFEATASAQHAAANAADGWRRSISASSDEAQPMRFNNLQEAAQKLAQERLAKLNDEHTKNREYRDYYGGSFEARSRLSIKGRRRASSDGSLNKDQEQSNKIRAQMSFFSSKLSEVDEKKRQHDREALIAAAQRNVAKSLHGMDEKVFADTGKIASSLLSEWEVKAHTAAQASSDNRMENYGKVNIGGGKFIDQTAVDLVAARNVKPVLDKINAKVEQERARQAELKLEAEANQRNTEEKKVRGKQEKEMNRKAKQQDKEEQKARKGEEKAAKAEEKRLAKEKRKSKDAPTPHKSDATEPALATGALIDSDIPTLAERGDATSTHAPIRTPMETEVGQGMQETANAANKGESTPMPPSPPKSPGSPKDGSKVKNWLKTKFSRHQSKSQKSPELKEAGSDKAFLGGAALTGASTNYSTSNLESHNSSMRDVALAGKTEDKENVPEKSSDPDSEVSSLSSLSDEPVENPDEFDEARDGFNEDLAPPPRFSGDPAKSHSPVRGSKFHEVI